MWRIVRLSFLLSIVGATQAGAAASGPAFCAAFDALAAQARTTGEPQRISIIKIAPMEVACTHQPGNAVQQAYCNAAIEVIGLEFHHAYPWQLRDCLRTEKVNPFIEARNEYTGLRQGKKIIHLAGRLQTGVRLDLLFAPFGGLEPLGYYGRYDLVIWSPGKV